MTTKLDKIVKDIDYGGNIDVRDPVTGVKDAKPAKPFLVENALINIESKSLTIPEEEDTEYGIVGQMRNFRVKRLSNIGHPIYTGEYNGRDNDHSLNALMLAFLGFTMEFGEMTRYDVSSHVANVTNVYTKLGIKRETIETENTSIFRNILRRNTPNFKNRDIVYNKPQMVNTRMEELQRFRRRKYGTGRENI